jgi:(aminoalkyl)phosphonate N-acetyltransferase
MIFIRPCIASDGESVRLMIEDLQKKKFQAAPFLHRFEANLQNPRVIYLAAFMEDQVIGFLSVHLQPLLHHEAEMAEVQELVVTPTQQHKGVGKKLVTHALTMLKEMGIPQLEVTCNKNRLDAHRFYEEIGFTNSHFKFTKRLED